MLTLVFTMLFVLPIGILDAYVIHDMWLWFAVPALAVNPITVVQAFGLNLLVHSVIRQPTHSCYPAYLVTSYTATSRTNHAQN